MAHLARNQYGKSRVRFLKVLRRDAHRHEICELEADVMLRGELERAYLSADNGSVVPTDTVKNTLQVLAHDCLETCRETFARAVGAHFLGTHPHLDGVSLELRERVWRRIEVDRAPHPHAFAHDANGEPFTRAEFRRGTAARLASGIREHLILKSTQSGFEGYAVCDLTTLPPTADRIFATRLTAEWTFAEEVAEGRAADFAAMNAQVLATARRVFASTYSPSVQRTLFQIGEAVLEEVPEIAAMQLTMPNVHFLPLDLGRLGRPDQTAVFLPTDEPFGQIEATITRD